MIAPGSLSAFLPTKMFKETVDMLKDASVSSEMEAESWSRRIIQIEIMAATRKRMVNYAVGAGLAGVYFHGIGG